MQLKNSFEFNIVFKDGISFNHKFLGIYALNRTQLEYKISKNKKYKRDLNSKVLLGFSINKKVAKATKRNLIKRRIKSIMHNIVNSGLDNIVFVFVCRHGILQWDFSTLNKYINATIHKILKNHKILDSVKLKSL